MIHGIIMAIIIMGSSWGYELRGYVVWQHLYEVSMIFWV